MTTRPASRRLMTALLVVALAAAAAGIYAASLPFPFQLDDFANLVDNPSIRVRDLRPGSILAATGQTTDVAGNRPVAFWTFALNYYFGGMDPWGYRLVNALIHGLNAALVWGLARSALRRALGREPPRWVPLAAALLWATNPVQTSAVVYVVQRMTSLATTFYLAALLAWVRGRSTRSPPWLGAALLLAAAGAATKEIAWVWPAGALLWELAFSRGLRSAVSRRPWAVGLGLALGLALFPLAHVHYRHLYTLYPFTWDQRLLTELRVVASYLSLLAFPAPGRLSLEHEPALSTGLLSPATTALSLGLHGALLALGAWALARRPVYGLALLGFYLHLVVESTVVPLDLMFEHRVYLPSVFLAVGLAGLLGQARETSALGPGGRRGLAAVALALAFLWGAWSWQRTLEWADTVTLWEGVLRQYPHHGRAHGSLGTEYYLRRDFPRARAHFRAALERYPGDVPSLVNLGMLEADDGNLPAALRLVSEAISLGGRHPIVFYNLGVVHTRMNQPRAALEAYQTALAAEPRLMGLNLAAGRAHAALGEPDRAADHYRRELALYPDTREARVRLAELEGFAPREPPR